MGLVWVCASRDDFFCNDNWQFDLGFRGGFWLVWWVLGAGLGVWVRACLRVGVVVWVSGGCVMLGAGCVFGWCWLRVWLVLVAFR